MWFAAASAGNKALFAGGLAGPLPTDVVDIYDFTTNSWSVAQLSQPRSGLVATSNGTQAIFAGGYYYDPSEGCNFCLSDVVDIYDSVSNSWSSASLSQARGNLAAASAPPFSVFVGGDHLNDGSGVVSGRVDTFDNLLNEWSWNGE